MVDHEKLKRLMRAGKCTYCKPHSGENRGRRPRPDKHKNKRRKP